MNGRTFKDAMIGEGRKVIREDGTKREVSGNLKITEMMVKTSIEDKEGVKELRGGDGDNFGELSRSLKENVANVVNNNENGRNRESMTNPLLNTTNPSIVGDLVTVTPYINAQSFVIKEELEKLFDKKNKSLNFLEFDLKLPYLAKVAVKSYPKDYTSSNSNNSTARQMMLRNMS
ncbi:H0502G05.11 protein [Theobroma cacao]|uniref:H0502G05.11 protein n=1 Tax=Theobroma cacao TaxID=3641 RepID=A0A061FVL0_THECC|nr:H0502G05.11 protein [Theobroma cacao]